MKFSSAVNVQRKRTLAFYLVACRIVTLSLDETRQHNVVLTKKTRTEVFM
jgi:hypothetical protein